MYHLRSVFSIIFSLEIEEFANIYIYIYFLLPLCFLRYGFNSAPIFLRGRISPKGIVVARFGARDGFSGGKRREKETEEKETQR